MEATLLLCDHAVVAEGKLYISGGGWTQIAAGRPIPMGLAINLSVAWDETNTPHVVVLHLITEDGHPVLDPEGNAWRAEAKFETGRPPGVPQGLTFGVPLAIVFPAIAMDPGGYRWEVLVDDNVRASASFRAIA